ncbi:type II secretion system F family protein [Aestuariicella hydrocarbonica]|uniref:Type II secretion system F family protein n=1 Tax=Pseudomaricurvus hydrocarbonicus TaxID=1470433 RepID=A0A9E5MMV4_9GAMM|nr:type II secretion system F family protein [Aestuariicella hydrocarbonica]NHO67146.1 type II secretion system F family protein [Aestuariicella hydrocarbonica]
MSQNYLFFIGLISAAVFLLSFALTTPVFGESKKNRARLQQRLRAVREKTEQPASARLLRDDYLSRLSPWEKQLESSEWLTSLTSHLQQAGYRIPAYRFVIIAVVVGLVAGTVAALFSNVWWVPVLVFLAGMILPFIKLSRDRNLRLESFEEQLPEALDIMKRALQAGHPLVECLHLVGAEMDDPIAQEFETTFMDLNYGNSIRTALLGLLERIPSVTVMALMTSVVIQKETGGNMAEIFDKLAKVIRGRYRFQRRVKTLSAEGRISAWVLCLVPFVLFGIISITTPSYLPILLETPTGQNLLIAAGVGMVMGIFVIRKIIRIEV